MNKITVQLCTLVDHNKSSQPEMAAVPEVNSGVLFPFTIASGDPCRLAQATELDYIVLLYNTP